MKVLLAQLDSRAGGGSLRAINFVKSASKLGCDIRLLALHMVTPDLAKFMCRYCKIAGYVDLDTVRKRLIRPRTTLTNILLLSGALRMSNRMYVRWEHTKDVNVLYGQHEILDVHLLLSELKSCLGVPAGTLLQLPPYYCSARWRNISLARRIFHSSLYGKRGLVNWLNEQLICSLVQRKARSLEKKLDFVVAVSRAVIADMGKTVTKTFILDPGVALEETDLRLLKKIVRSTGSSKKNYIVFGGRPRHTKGIVEALYVFARVVRSANIKLVVTGSLNKEFEHRLLKLCKRLGVLDKVVFTGFVPREDRLRLVASARVMLYPSHEDSFPFAVLESVLLGTPVVGYDIPALRIYYGNVPGVRLVPEFDLEGLEQALVEMYEQPEKPQPPRLPDWKTIVEEELEILRQVAKR